MNSEHGVLNGLIQKKANQLNSTTFFLNEEICLMLPERIRDFVKCIEFKPVSEHLVKIYFYVGENKVWLVLSFFLSIYW